MEEYKYTIKDIANLSTKKIAFVKFMAVHKIDLLKPIKKPGFGKTFYYNEVAKDLLLEFLNKEKTPKTKAFKVKIEKPKVEGYKLYADVIKNIDGIQNINRGSLQQYLIDNKIIFKKNKTSLYIPDIQVDRCMSLTESFIDYNTPLEFIPNNYIAMEFHKVEKNDKIKFLYKLCNTCDVIEEIILQEEIKNKIK